MKENRNKEKKGIKIIKKNEEGKWKTKTKKKNKNKNGIIKK